MRCFNWDLEVEVIRHIDEENRTDIWQVRSSKITWLVAKNTRLLRMKELLCRRPYARGGTLGFG